MNIYAQKNYYKILMGMLTTIGILLLALVICFIPMLITSNQKDPAPIAEESAPETSDNDKQPSGDEGNSVVLSQTADAGQAYQDKLIFVGDSLTAHLIHRGGLTGGKDTKQVWRPESNTLNLDSKVTSAKIIYPETGELMTIAEAAAKAKPEIMIITLGTNYGVSYLTENDFKACYTKLIRDVQKASPETTVILQSIFPVTTTCTSKTLTNDKIDTCNEWVKEIAKDNGCPYLDTQSVLKDSNNALKPEYSSDATYQNDDGIHLTATAYSVILQYIRTHAYTPVA